MNTQQQENNFSFSNQPSSRRSNHLRLSKQSTNKSIRLDSTRDEQQPPLSSKQSYRRLHSKELKHLAEDPTYQRVQLGKLQYKSAVVIQRFWRFYLLMRRKVQDGFLRKLSIESQSLERLLRNEEIREELLHRQLQSMRQNQQTAVKELLAPSKQLTFEFAQKSMLHSVSRGSHLQNLRLAASYQQRELQTNLNDYRRAKQRLDQLTRVRQQKLERERELTAKASSLSQQLMMQNALKVKLQCQCDQLKVSNARLRCSDP